MSLVPLHQSPSRALFKVAGTFADYSVVLSFSRVGYFLRRQVWDDADLRENLTGRVCVVTGANSGIGRATALGLAERGATVILACRNEARGQEAESTLRQQTGNSNLFYEHLDTASLATVRAFAGRVRARFPLIHVLVNNAGTMLPDRIETVDGIEANFSTNVLGHFLLTNLLAPAMVAAAPSRIIHVTSGGMYTQKLKVHDLQSKLLHPFNGVLAYAQNKRAQVILSELYSERLRGTGVTSNAVHPGWAATPAVATALPRFNRVMGPLLRTWEEGADTVLWLAVARRIEQETGQLWFDRLPRWTHVTAATRNSDTECRFLWEECVRLCGVDLDYPRAALGGGS